MKKRISRSKYRKYLIDILPSEVDIEEIDNLVNDYKTTYIAIYNCLHYGLTLEETWFIMETQRALSFAPSFKSLRILFHYFNKDKDMLLEAVEFVDEYGDAFQRDEGPSCEWFMERDNWVYGFKNMLQEHNNSLDSLKMHIDSLEWDEGIEYE